MIRSTYLSVLGIFTTALAFGFDSPSALRQYNLLTKQNVTLQASRVDGRLASLGNIQLTDYSVGGALPTDKYRCDILSASDLTFSRGSVPQGAICIAGYTRLSQVVQPPVGPVYVNQLYREVQEAEEYSSYISRMWGPTPASSPGKPLSLLGSDPEINTFTVPASHFLMTTEINIEAPAGSIVIVNVVGNSFAFQSGAIHLRGVSPEQVLFNLASSTQVTLSQVDWKGSILAPYARFNFNSGRLDGSVMVSQATGNGYYGSHPFTP